MKTMIWMGFFIGGAIGGVIPYLWGNYAFFSFSSIFLSAAGGLVGIWAGYKVGKFFGV